MESETIQLANHNTSDLIEIEKQNPFLTSKVKRKINSRDCRILFLYPNERGMSTIPPSITSLSQILKDEGHQTALFDTTFYKFDDEITLEDSDDVKAKAVENRPILERDDDDLHFKKTTRSAVLDFETSIENFKPDFIAVSCTETTFLRAMKLIDQTRHKNIKNLFGGVFPTFAPELVMSYKNIDMVCVGEGENAIIDLANSISNEEEYSDVTNLWIRQKDGTITKNSISRPVNIDDIPTITDIALFGEKRFYRPMGGKIRRLLPVETHRGCPYTCSFCNSPGQNRLYGDGDFLKGMSFFRKKSMDLVKTEIENHIKKYDVEYIYFWADTFLAWNNKEFDEFCDMYSEFKLPFWCQTRIETIEEDKFRRLKELGLDRVTFGLEHGNEKFRREIVKRDYSNDDAVKKIKIIEKLGITFSVNNIIGFPDETRELAFDTIELNRRFNSDNTSCSILVPFHGTELHDYAVKKGYIDPNIICAVSNSGESLLNMPQWDKKDMTRLRDVFAMYIKFPKERWPEIKKAETDEKLRTKLRYEFVKTYWSDSAAKIEDDIAEAAKGLF
jgi:anaerobic magnesium-protoporphyrin IX monomethyl ester cyclase